MNHMSDGMGRCNKPENQPLQNLRQQNNLKKTIKELYSK